MRSERTRGLLTGPVASRKAEGLVLSPRLKTLCPPRRAKACGVRGGPGVCRAFPANDYLLAFSPGEWGFAGAHIFRTRLEPRAYSRRLCAQ